jgi:hypothetical protein
MMQSGGGVFSQSELLDKDLEPNYYLQKGEKAMIFQICALL